VAFRAADQALRSGSLRRMIRRNYAEWNDRKEAETAFPDLRDRAAKLINCCRELAEEAHRPKKNATAVGMYLPFRKAARLCTVKAHEHRSSSKVAFVFTGGRRGLFICNDEKRIWKIGQENKSWRQSPSKGGSTWASWSSAWAWPRPGLSAVRLAPKQLTAKRCENRLFDILPWEEHFTAETLSMRRYL
jgi:hypothetical protein